MEFPMHAWVCSRCGQFSATKSNLDRHIAAKCRDAIAHKVTGRFVPDHLVDDAGPAPSPITRTLDEMSEFTKAEYIQRIQKRVPVFAPGIQNYAARVQDIRARKDLVEKIAACTTHDSLAVTVFRVVTGDLAIPEHRFLWCLDGTDAIVSYNRRVVLRKKESLAKPVASILVNMVKTLGNGTALTFTTLPDDAWKYLVPIDTG